MKKLFLFLTLLLPFQSIYAAPEISKDVVEHLTPKLNSDRIAYFFGSYGVEPIEFRDSPFGECRIANLYSLDGNEKIMRTLAIVDFKQPVHDELKEVHQEIVQGQSIGIALKKAGWNVEKLPVYFGSVELSPALQAWMHETSCNIAAIHVYKLSVSNENSKGLLPYCTIIEVHSPQYLDEKWLQALYPDQYPYFKENFDQINVLRCLIDRFPKKIEYTTI